LKVEGWKVEDFRSLHSFAMAVSFKIEQRPRAVEILAMTVSSRLNSVLGFDTGSEGYW
jgi:hypothetical protein